MKWYIWVLCIAGGLQLLKIGARILTIPYEGLIEEYYHRRIQGQIQDLYTRIGKLENK